MFRRSLVEPIFRARGQGGDEVLFERDETFMEGFVFCNNERRVELWCEHRVVQCLFPPSDRGGGKAVAHARIVRYVLVVVVYSRTPEQRVADEVLLLLLRYRRGLLQDEVLECRSLPRKQRVTHFVYTEQPVRHARMRAGHLPMRLLKDVLRTRPRRRCLERSESPLENLNGGHLELSNVERGTVGVIGYVQHPRPTTLNT